MPDFASKIDNLTKRLDEDPSLFGVLVEKHVLSGFQHEGPSVNELAVSPITGERCINGDVPR